MFKNYFKIFINFYNDAFFKIFIPLLLVLFIMMVMCIYLSKEDNDEEISNIKFILEKRVIKVVLYAFICFFLFICLNEAFSINIMELLDLSKYGRIILTICIIISAYSDKKLYRRLSRISFFRDVHCGKYDDFNIENMILRMINECNVRYSLELEKLGILKSLAPIFLSSPIFTYIIRGTNLKISWEWVTLVFFSFICLYFIYIINCYGKIKELKEEELEIKRELDFFYERHNNTLLQQPNLKQNLNN